MGALVEHYGKRDPIVQPTSHWVIRQHEKELEKLIQRINTEVASIELIIAHQRTLGNTILTIDNVTARKISNLATEFSHLKQDTFTKTDKRVWQWASVFFNVAGGFCALGSVPAGALTVGTMKLGELLSKCYEAGAGFAKGSETIAGMTDSAHQKDHAIFDHESQQLRTQKDAVMGSESRMKSANDNIINMLAKYYEALYQLRIALARMI